ncbi:hypothetical protein KCU64_g8655, partial [Aureobasidium melanogenum]
MAESSNTWGPSSSPLMVQEKKAADTKAADEERAADEANDIECSHNANQIPPSGSTGDVLADRLGAIEKHIAGIKNILEKLDQTVKNMGENIDRRLSDLRKEAKVLRNELSRFLHSGDSSRDEPGAPPLSSVRITTQSNFDKQAPFNPVPADHPAYLFVVVSNIDFTRQFGYPTIGREGGSFVTVEGSELARFDGEGRVFDMTPKDSFVDNFLDLVDQ